LAPYTLVYSATILLIVVRTALRIAPWAVRGLALVANPALLGVPVLRLAAGVLGIAIPSSRVSMRRPVTTTSC
jgi:hypothetical protein